jgi:hypothetical protein
VQSYADSHQARLPFLTDSTPGTPTRAHLESFFYALLPYVEQDNLYRAFDPTNPTTYNNAVANSPGVTQQILPLFQCPSDFSNPGNPTFMASATITPPPPPPFLGFYTGTYACSNYAANGLVFRTNAAIFPASILDGASNTIFFAERYQVCNDSAMFWGYGGFGNVNPSFGFLALPGVGLPTNMFAPDVPLRVDGNGNVYGKLGLDSTLPGTITKPVPFQVGPQVTDCDPSLAQTPHTSGMQAAMGDGSVRLVNGSISQLTFWSACTPAGREVLGTDW